MFHSEGIFFGYRSGPKLCSIGTDWVIQQGNVNNAINESDGKTKMPLINERIYLAKFGYDKPHVFFPLYIYII